LVTTAVGENRALRAANAARVVPDDAQSLVSACSISSLIQRARALARRGRDYARRSSLLTSNGRALLAAYPRFSNVAHCDYTACSVGGKLMRPRLGWHYLSTNTAFAFLALRRVTGE
jgi:hypothetical protein